MNLINDLVPENLVSAFGWMIVHSIWQGALIAFLLSIILFLLNTRSAHVRYLVALGALLIFTSAAVRTFLDHYQPAKNNNIIESVSADRQEILPEDKSLLPGNYQPKEPGVISRIDSWFREYLHQYMPLIVFIYLLGVLFLTLKLTGGFLYTQRIKHYRVNEAESKYQTIVSRISSMLDIKKEVKLMESALVKIPQTIGYFKPVILFPLGTLTGMSSNQLEAAIAHELAHIKRADYLVNFFQSLLEVVFFYHPAVWWISSIIRDERENVCDDLAVDACGKPSALAKALVYIGYNKIETGFAVGLAGNQNKLKRRVTRMIGENKTMNSNNRIYASALILLAVLSFGFYACGSANSDSYSRNKADLVFEEEIDGDKKYINTDRLNDDARRYIFYTRLNGDKIKWDVTIENGRIAELYKNDKIVPQKDYKLYDNMIYNEIEYIDENLVDLQEDLKDLEDELAYWKEDLADIEFDENFERDMHELKLKLRQEFDCNEFRHDMENLKSELKKLKRKEWSWKFDSEEFRKNMEEMREDLMNMKIEFDSEEFAESMAEMSRQLASIKVHIPPIKIPEINTDMSELEEGMKELSESLEDLDIDMSELKTEMKKFKHFMRELKNEMVEDGLIDKYDDIDNLEFEDDALYLNYEKVPGHLAEKYREIYKKHFGHYPDEDSFTIHN